jgi:hypothetical protein
LRQQRSYGAVRQTHREVGEHQNSPEALQPTRNNYRALQQTQRQVDEQQNSRADSGDRTSGEGSNRPRVLRTWTQYGGMEPQQDSARKWIKQNHEIRMAAANNSGANREEPAQGSTRGQGAESPQSNRGQDQAGLEKARAIVEEARQREAAAKAREHERSGPER